MPDAESRYRNLNNDELILETITSETPLDPALLHEVERRGLQHEACRLSLKSIILAREDEMGPHCDRLENWKAVRYLIEQARERAGRNLLREERERIWDAIEAVLDKPEREHPVCELERYIQQAVHNADEARTPPGGEE